ncbi:MAG: hypothetical protein C3F07_03290 [Anaerolineales bacterium]|nr:hypothetical protein [Anaerolineae bacterium]PWB76698.1 MAG: hypothetical protein C3F07_03290 [Anaerolineales bacterium]
MKRLFSYFGLALLMVLLTGVLAAAAPMPNVDFTLVQGLPDTMHVGDTYTVVVDVTSDVPFNSVLAMPNPQYPGKGVVPVKGGDHAGAGTSATVEVTFTAKSAPDRLPGGKDVMSVVVGVRYKGGVVIAQEFPFEVTVLP